MRLKSKECSFTGERLSTWTAMLGMTLLKLKLINDITGTDKLGMTLFLKLKLKLISDITRTATLGTTPLKLTWLVTSLEQLTLGMILLEIDITGTANAGDDTFEIDIEID
jgi:hypothetical protein